jgi:hypothetical protein
MENRKGRSCADPVEAIGVSARTHQQTRASIAWNNFADVPPLTPVFAVAINDGGERARE